MSTGFGEFLVLRRLLTPRAVLNVLKHQARARPHIGELAVHKAWLTWGQVLGIVSLAERMQQRFGDTAQKEGLLNAGQIELLLKEQEAATPSLSDCILDLGFIDRHVLDREYANFEATMKLTRKPVSSLASTTALEG
jgi:hypothetical protein